MHCREDLRRELGFQDLAAIAGHPKRWTENRLRRRRAETNEQLRPNEPQLRFEPGPARGNFARIGFLVDAALPARFPLKMLHRVRDVNLGAIDPRFFERAIEKLAGWTDEWFTRQIFLISRLLAQEHKRRAFRSFAENGLGSVSVERAGCATSGSFCDNAQARRIRHGSGGAVRLLLGFSWAFFCHRSN